MRCIRTPTGEIFKYEDCEDFDDDFCGETEVFFNEENQEILAIELFKQAGILVADEKGV